MTYAPNSVNFDGTNDYLTRGGALSGITDSKLCTGSVWLRRHTVSGVIERILYTGGTAPRPVIMTINADNTIVFFFRNPTVTIAQFGTSAISNTVWRHVMWSFDLASTSNRHCYVDNVSDLATITTYTNDIMDLDRATDWFIGSEDAGANKLNADLADLQIWFGTYVDLSQQANRELFLLAGAPVDPATAVTTLGSPIISFSGITDTWHTNDGTGGGFTENGALTDGTPVVAVYAQTAYRFYNDDGIGLGEVA